MMNSNLRMQKMKFILQTEALIQEAVMRQLRGHVSVVTLHSVNGRWDLVA